MPTLEFLTPPGDGPCMVRGSILPGDVVPLHSHPDPETFYALSGELEGYADGWVTIRPGDVFHVAADVPHAFRNRARGARRLRSSPRRRGSAPSCARRTRSPRDVAELAARHGHWLATPQENTAIDLEEVPT